MRASAKVNCKDSAAYEAYHQTEPKDYCKIQCLCTQSSYITLTAFHCLAGKSTTSLGPSGSNCYQFKAKAGGHLECFCWLIGFCARVGKNGVTLNHWNMKPSHRLLVIRLCYFLFFLHSANHLGSPSVSSNSKAELTSVRSCMTQLKL